MKYYLPTKEECDDIVENSEAFYKADREVEGYKVAMYDYRLASISDFTNNNAFELRGITFIYNPETKIWERNLLMNKFFNIGETEGWLIEDVKDKKIIRIQNKEDGSIITPIRLPNGVIRMKSKMSFESDQAQLAQECFMEGSHSFRKFITNCLNNNVVPAMELVGYKNQIVLNYDVDKELVLLQIRREDGTYFTRKEMEDFTRGYDIKVTEDFDIEKIENIANKYSEENIINMIKNKKFETFDEFINFLSK